MRPVELQPPAVQALNVQQQSQAHATAPGTAQQAFAAQMQREASQRPSMVRETEQQTGTERVNNPGEDRGERARRRGRRGKTVKVPAEAPGPTQASGPETGGSKVDLIV